MQIKKGGENEKEDCVAVIELLDGGSANTGLMRSGSTRRREASTTNHREASTTNYREASTT